MDPNLTGLIAYAGDNKDALAQEMYIALELQSAGITVIPNLKGKMTLHKLLIAAGVKPFTGVFKAKSDVSFSNRSLSVEKAQRDMQIMPSKYLQTWMEKRRGKGENPNNMTIPFAEVLWDSVMKELAQEIATGTIYHGVGKDAFPDYSAGTAYAAGDLIAFVQDEEERYFEAAAPTSAGQNPTTNPLLWKWAGAKALCKGYKVRLDEEEALGTILPVSTGPINSIDAYEQFTMVWRKLPEILQMNGGFIYCSFNSYQMLNDSYETKISKNFETIDGITYLAKTDRKCVLKPVPWLSGSGKLIASPSGNFWLGTDQESDMTTMKIIEQMYHLDLGMSFMIGTQIADPAALRTNDQD